MNWYSSDLYLNNMDNPHRSQFMSSEVIGYRTYYSITSQTISNWVVILTGLMALTGFGSLATAFTESPPDKSNSTDAKNRAAEQ